MFHQTTQSRLIFIALHLMNVLSYEALEGHRRQRHHRKQQQQQQQRRKEKLPSSGINHRSSSQFMSAGPTWATTKINTQIAFLVLC